jgi:hypothetical protein
MKVILNKTRWISTPTIVHGEEGKNKLERAITMAEKRLNIQV